MIHFHARLEINEANAFIVACPETREAMLIDVGEWNDELKGFLETNELTLAAIYITHDHYDHTAGLADALAYAGDVPVYAFNPTIENHETIQVAPGDTLSVGHCIGTLYMTPGHTPDGLTLVFPGHCYSGDALFNGSVGGTSSQEDYDTQLAAIREHIFTLPPETRVHSGHGPSTTVAIESKYNPFFV